MIKLRTVFVALTISILCSDFSRGDQHEQKDKEPQSSSRFGDALAVTAFNKEEGFKLSELSLNTLGVKFYKLTKEAPWTVPKDALVFVKHSTGVYRRTEGWITLVLVKVMTKNAGEAQIQSDDLQIHDEVAIQGTQFLRMAELDLSADTVDTCSH